MRRTLALLCAASTLFACELFALPDADGGTDGAVDAGPDAGRPDASLPPLELTFVEVSLPAVTSPMGLVSAGATLYALSTIGSATSGSLQGVIIASADEGRTWSVRSVSATNQLEPTPDGGLYGLSSQSLGYSSTEARSFTPVTVPASIPLSPPPKVNVTADGALWLTSFAAPFAVERSTDDGASFTPVPLPADTTRLQPCVTRGPRFAALRNGDEVIASDGVGFQSLGALGTVAGPATCLVLPSGTVLVTADVGSAYDVLRLPAGGSTWERTSASGFFRFAVSADALVRTLTSGQVDESMDDGASWTPRVGATPTGVVIAEAALVGSTLVAFSPGMTLRLPAGATAWEELVTPGVPPFLRVADLSFATKKPGAAALLLEDNIQRTLYVTEDGVTWRRGRTLVKGAASALAMSPDGTQALLGAIDGTYRVFADAGTTVVIDSRIETAAGQRDPNAIRQATWDLAAGGNFILVTTGNDADTTGSVWQLNPDNDNRSWVERRPFSTTTAPAVRRGGYGALCVSTEAPAPALTRSLVVSLRSNTSANAFLNYLLTHQPALDPAGWWLQDDPPVGFSGALTASCNGAWGKGLAVLWPERRLWVGRVTNELREVPLPPGMPAPTVARFDGTGRLWLGTPSGLWRTPTPVVLE